MGPGREGTEKEVRLRRAIRELLVCAMTLREIVLSGPDRQDNRRCWLVSASAFAAVQMWETGILERKKTID